jgi:hypothetical protein
MRKEEDLFNCGMPDGTEDNSLRFGNVCSPTVSVYNGSLLVVISITYAYSCMGTPCRNCIPIRTILLTLLESPIRLQEDEREIVVVVFAHVGRGNSGAIPPLSPNHVVDVQKVP